MMYRKKGGLSYLVFSIRTVIFLLFIITLSLRFILIWSLRMHGNNRIFLLKQWSIESNFFWSLSDAVCADAAAV